MQGAWHDIRYGLRRLLKQPAFTGLAVVTLALGVGAATTIFSVIQSVLLDPFPYKDADRVAGVLVYDLGFVRPGGRTAFPLPEFLEYQQQNHVFEEVIGGGHEDVLIATGEGPEQFDGAFVTPNTFRFLGVPALLGRGLVPEDAAPGAPPVFVIVGVIADVRNRGIQEAPMPEVLVPYTITGAFDRSILVKTAGDPGALLNGVRREIWSVDRNVALTFAGTLAEYLKLMSYAEPRFSALVLGAFAGLGLMLSVIGVYSVIAYTVAQRTHEIGIRMAMGASRADVLWMIVRMGFRLVGVGLVAGLLASFGMTRLIASQLWGVSPHDPFTLFGVVTIVLAAALLACYVPARKATIVDPIIALKVE